MRGSIIGSAMIAAILLGLGLSSAAARQATPREARTYPHCVCSFGYGNDPCSVAVSCEAEGGSCLRSCGRRPPQ